MDSKSIPERINSAILHILIARCDNDLTTAIGEWDGIKHDIEAMRYHGLRGFDFQVGGQRYKIVTCAIVEGEDWTE